VVDGVSDASTNISTPMTMVSATPAVTRILMPAGTSTKNAGSEVRVITMTLAAMRLVTE
jgi:hypothetical protein